MNFPKYLGIIATTGLFMVEPAMAKSPKENLPAPKIGEEFKMKNVFGTEVAVTIIERAGKQYIRSRYHHGWGAELREYPIPSAISSFFINGSSINVIYSKRGENLAGAVYIINYHGEAVKVDDITIVDLTW